MGRLPDDLPPPVRGAAYGALALGVLGCLVGLVLGWRTYPPTAWAATFEVGIPAAVLGAVVGAAGGWLRTRATRRP